MKLKSKLLLYLLVSAVIGAVTFSCSDQDFPDPNNLSLDSQFADVQNMANGLEAGMRNEFDIYLQVVSIFGREAYYFQGADPRYTGELLKGPIDNGGFLVTRSWNARYRVIRTANTMLEKIPSLGLSAEHTAGATGFAKTVQAYQFLMNLNFTHDNGIRTDVAGDAPGPFVDRAEALTFIANLLDEADAELSQAGSAFSFTLSSGFDGFDDPIHFSQFNRALKARVSAYREDWDGVLDAVGHSFVSSQAESLDAGVYHAYSQSAGDLLNPIFENQQAASLLWHGHPSIQADAEEGDNRFSSKINIRDTPGTLDGLSSNLGITLASSNTSSFPLIRNQELVLLRAEANIHKGNMSDAEADLNFIRDEAGLAPITLTDTDSAINQMLHERRYSLYCEGHRWIDMRRYNKLGELPIDRPEAPSDVVIDQMPRPAAEFSKY